jgi:ATP-binding cassette subfamily F protein 3
VRLLLDPPNLLLMDEPTTHLDMGSIDALIQALEDFEGTLVFISHDVHFIRAMARSVIHIAGGVLTPYAGDYQYYLDKTKASSAREALTRSKLKKEAEQKVTKIEETLAQLDKRKHELVALLHDEATYADAAKFRALTLEMEGIEPKIAKETAAWEKATEELEAFADKA